MEERICRFLSSEWNTERVREDASGDSEDGEDYELPCVIGESAGDCVWRGSRRSVGSSLNRQGAAYRKERLVIFTALHGMQTRSSDENSVRPSVSVTRVYCDKTVERSVQIYIPYERTFSLVFWEEEWLVGTTPSTWNFGSTGPCWSKIADFKPIIAPGTSAVTPSEKSSINANRKSSTRFLMSLWWSSYVAPKFPKGGLKNAERPISIKKCTSLEESLLQSFFVWKLSAAEL